MLLKLEEAKELGGWAERKHKHTGRTTWRFTAPIWKKKDGSPGNIVTHLATVKERGDGRFGWWRFKSNWWKEWGETEQGVSESLEEAKTLSISNKSVPV